MELIAAAQSIGWTDVVSAVATALAALAAVGTLVIVVVTAGYARAQINEAKRTRHAESLFHIAEAWEGEALVKARKLTVRAGSGAGLLAKIEAEIATASDDYFDLIRLPTFFEDLGLLEREGGVTLAIVDRRFGTFIPYSFRLWKPSIDFLRKRSGRDDVYLEFEALSKRIEEYEKAWRPAEHARPVAATRSR